MSTEHDQILWKLYQEILKHFLLNQRRICPMMFSNISYIPIPPLSSKVVTTGKNESDFQLFQA